MSVSISGIAPQQTRPSTHVVTQERRENKANNTDVWNFRMEAGRTLNSSMTTPLEFGILKHIALTLEKERAIIRRTRSKSPEYTQVWLRVPKELYAGFKEAFQESDIIAYEPLYSFHGDAYKFVGALRSMQLTRSTKLSRPSRSIHNDALSGDLLRSKAAGKSPRYMDPMSYGHPDMDDDPYIDLGRVHRVILVAGKGYEVSVDIQRHTKTAEVVAEISFSKARGGFNKAKRVKPVEDPWTSDAAQGKKSTGNPIRVFNQVLRTGVKIATSRKAKVISWEPGDSKLTKLYRKFAQKLGMAYDPMSGKLTIETKRLRDYLKRRKIYESILLECIIQYQYELLLEGK